MLIFGREFKKKEGVFWKCKTELKKKISFASATESEVSEIWICNLKSSRETYNTHQLHS